MKRQRWMLQLLFVVGLCGYRSAEAQYGLYTARSLEWLTADADVVARGVVAEVRPEETEDGDGWRVITINVTENLKGSQSRQLKFAFFTGRNNPLLEEWQAAGHPILWFVNRAPRAAPDLAPALPRPAPSGILERNHIDLYASGYLWSAIRLSPGPRRQPGQPPPPIMNLDLKPLTHPEEILKATRQAIAIGKGKERPRLHRLGVPHTVILQTGTAGDINEILVPVDARLERLARRLIQSPGDFSVEPKAVSPPSPLTPKMRASIVRSNRDALRASGIQALRYFKSADNIALLKPLLKDPAVMLVTGGPSEQTAVGPPPRNGQRVYYLRKAAYEVLQAWSITVPKPVLQEALPNEEAAPPP